MVSLLRILKTGFQNYYRSLGTSVGTTVVMILTLFTISAIFLLNVLTGIAIESVEQKVDVSVYFNTEAEASKVLEYKGRVDQIPDVLETRYISKEEALAEFRDDHSGNELVLESLEELDQNPLQSVLVVKAHDPEQYEGIVSTLESMNGSDGSFGTEDLSLSYTDEETYMTASIVDKISYEDNREVISRLNNITGVVQKGGIGVGGFFGVVALLVMFNTIRMTIVGRKDEIAIMRLVGAKNGFIRWPFIVTGMLYGGFAALVTLAVLYPVVRYISPKISRFFEGFGEELISYFQGNLGMLFLGLLGIGLLLGIISSSVAVRKYLKV